MPGRRRTHHKSRIGCVTCKLKKIKCDEQKPLCQYCTDRSLECIYALSAPTSAPPPAPALAALDSTTASASAPGSTPASAQASTSPPPIRFSAVASPQRRSRTPCRPTTNTPAVSTPLTSTLSPFDISEDGLWKRSDLELLHFYTSSTYLTFSNDPLRRHVWQFVVPQIAFSNDFLLHGLLAISALHLSRIVPEREHALSAIASGHHSAALPIFRSAINNVTSQNCQACSVFGTILVVYELGSNTTTNCLFFSTAAEPSSPATLECIQLLRGSAHIVSSYYDTIMQGPLKPTFTWDNADELAAESNPVESARFSTLSKLWDPMNVSVSVAEAEALDEALRWLQIIYTTMITCCGRTDPASSALAWPVRVPEFYLLMVDSRQPAALIILAHFCLLLNKVEDFWWIQGLSRRLLKEIDRKLGKQWETWISWPLQDLVLTEFRNSACAN